MENGSILEVGDVVSQDRSNAGNDSPEAESERSHPASARTAGRGRKLRESLASSGPLIALVVLLFSVVAAPLWKGWLGRTLAVIAGLISFAALLHGPPGQWLRAWLERPWPGGGLEKRRLDLAVEVFCPLMVAAVTFGLFYKIFLGEPPLSSDHPLHLFQGWVMADHLLPSGRVSGWVHLRGAGYPAGVLYPIGGNLLLAVVRYLLPGSVSWEMVYGVGFLIAMTAVHLALYLTGRTVGGPWVGLVAGLLSAVDQGAYRQSGWSFAVYVGVWPVSLSMAEALLAAVLLHHRMVRPRDRRDLRSLLLVALLIGASVVTHPMSLAFLTLALPVVLIHAGLETERQRPWRAIGRGIGAAALGLALSAFWLLPFLAFRDYSRTLGTGSVILNRQAQGIVDLTFFGNLWPVAAALALFGGVAAWRARFPTGRLLTLLFALIALAVNGTTLVSLELDRWWPRLSNIQPDRFYLYLRPLAYLLAGLGAVWVARRAGAVISPKLSGARRWGLRVLACVAFGAYLLPVAEAVFWEEISPRGYWQSYPVDYAHYRQVCAFIRHDVAETSDEHRGFVRTVWPPLCPTTLGDSGHCFEASPIYTGVGHFHPAYHSAAGFRGLFGFMGRGGSNELLRALGVRYRVTAYEQPGQRALFHSGPLWVYPVRRAAPGPFTVRGQAEVRLERFDDELVVMTVEDAAAGDRITLHIPYFPNWHAFLDDRELPIDLVPIEGIDQAMDLPLRDGRLELRYQRGAPEIGGALVSLLALLIALALVSWNRLVPLIPERLRERATKLGEGAARELRHRRRLAAAAAAVLTLILIAGAALEIAHRVRHGRPSFDTVLDFERARIWTLDAVGREPCHRTSTEAWRCGSKRNDLVGPTYVWTTMGRTHGAILAHPIKDAELHIDFPEVRLTSALEGGMGIEHGGGGRAGVVLAIRADGRELCRRVFDQRYGWTWFRCDTAERAGERVRLEFVVSCARPRVRHFVFRAWTDDGDPPAESPDAPDIP